MNLNRIKIDRSKDCTPERSPRKVGSVFNRVYSGIHRGIDKVYNKIKGLRKPTLFRSQSELPERVFYSNQKKIYDPRGPFLQRWNKIFVLCCLLSVSFDPLFFYIPVMDRQKNCLDLDRKLEVTASILRSVTDIFYILHIIFEFRTGFYAPFSRVLGMVKLVEDTEVIAKRYMCSYFIIDILAILPLPQLVLLLVVPYVKSEASLIGKEMLKWVIFCQYVPRFIRIYPIFKEVTRTFGIFGESAWAGAALSLFLYMLASHVVGALWYLFSIGRKDSCWREACKEKPECKYNYLYCDKYQTGNNSFLKDACPAREQDDIDDFTKVFDFGIFLDAIKSGVLERKDFRKKFSYCFWWGLRNLSSLGQNLKTSTDEWEICFAICVAIVGLLLFSLIIGNMLQKFLPSISAKIEEMRAKRQDIEQWMSHRMLPTNLRQRIRRYEQYKWQETKGVEEDNLVNGLPRDLRRDIKRHLCLDLVKRVPMFGEMDEQLMDAICERLKPILFTEDSVIVREGDPVPEMLFVMRGKLVSTTTDGGRSDFFNSASLKAGDFCGEELLTWALDPRPSFHLPSSTRNVKALTEVEAFALLAEDIKFVASQFRRLHSTRFQHTFRFYSQQWRTWAACFIQAAWRRHCKKKLERSLREAEGRIQNALANGTEFVPSLGAAIYASRFTTNALRALRQNRSRRAKLPSRVLPSLAKPVEPDYSP